MLDSCLGLLTGAIKGGASKYDDLLESEPPVSVGTFLDKNARLLSLLGVFSVVTAALPQFLPVDSREFAYGAVGALVTLLIVLLVFIYRLTIQVIHAFSERRFTRLSQHLFLHFGLLNIAGSIGFAVWQYRSRLLAYVDFVLLVILFYAFIAICIAFDEDQVSFIAGFSGMLSVVTQLVFDGFFDQYEPTVLPIVSTPSATVTVLSSLATLLLLALVYYVVLRTTWWGYRHVRTAYVSHTSD